MAGPISSFLEHHFRHFNAREVLAAAAAWREHCEAGGKMFLAMAGAMSTAELGLSLAPMIRAGKIHAISTTAANLEADIFNLVAHREYHIANNWRPLCAAADVKLDDDDYRRGTDRSIPESVIRFIEGELTDYWTEAAEKHEAYFPYEYLYRLIASGDLDKHLQIPQEHSWVVAAQEAGIPIYSPGFEDSTMGNVFAARVMDGTVRSHAAVRSGTEQMQHLVEWYREEQARAPIGFFQIGGGIAGDFAICSVPLLIQDLHEEVNFWSYFAQISDSTTSYGSYSGAVPNEKITWWKLDQDAPMFMINSDAAIVAPLIFAYVLGE